MDRKVNDLYDSLVMVTHHNLNDDEFVRECKNKIEYHRDAHGLTDEQIELAVNKFQGYARIIGAVTNIGF